MFPEYPWTDFAIEGFEMRAGQMDIERRAIVVDLVEKHARGIIWVGPDIEPLTTGLLKAVSSLIRDAGGEGTGFVGGDGQGDGDEIHGEKANRPAWPRQALKTTRAHLP